MGGPDSRLEWQGAIRLLHTCLGLGGERELPGVHDVFLDVGQLLEAAEAAPGLHADQPAAARAGEDTAAHRGRLPSTTTTAHQRFTLDELLAWASQHEDDERATLGRRIPFRFRVSPHGIEYITGTGNPRHIRRNELASFYEEFQASGSFSPGHYRTRWHKSYSLPLIQRFLEERRGG